MDLQEFLKYVAICVVVAAVGTGIAFGIMAATDTGVFDNPYCENNDNPCNNGGTCVSDGNDKYNCDCTINWEGDECENPTIRGLNDRPCKKDEPCYHNAKCKDIDENNDGVYEDYKCECPEIVGIPGKHWEGKDCNDFPRTIKKDDYDISCFTDVGKTDLQKEYLQKCENEKKCSLPDDMMNNCEHNCNESLTHVWCNDDDDEKCIDRFDENEIRGCDSLWAKRKEEHDLHVEERQSCNSDPDTKWDYHHHKCVNKISGGTVSPVSPLPPPVSPPPPPAPAPKAPKAGQ